MRTPAPTVQPAPTDVRSPMEAPAPTVECGPIQAEAAISAPGAITAVGWTPGITGFRGYSTAITAAKLARGLETRITVRPAGKSAVTIKHPASDWPLLAAALRFCTNAISRGPADSSAAAPEISRSPDPS